MKERNKHRCKSNSNMHPELTHYAGVNHNSIEIENPQVVGIAGLGRKETAAHYQVTSCLLAAGFQAKNGGLDGLIRSERHCFYS